MNDVCAIVEVTNSTSETARISQESEPNYQCDDCEMVFNALALLTEHKKTHGEVQNSFKCQDCDKTFRSKYPLTLHQRVHSGARPFECEVLNDIISKFILVCDWLKHVRQLSVSRSCRVILVAHHGDEDNRTSIRSGIGIRFLRGCHFFFQKISGKIFSWNC
jgi:hypothetical protein